MQQEFLFDLCLPLLWVPSNEGQKSPAMLFATHFMFYNRFRDSTSREVEPRHTRYLSNKYTEWKMLNADFVNVDIFMAGIYKQ